MARDAHQPTLVDTLTVYRYWYCRRCGRPITRAQSRLNGYGAECDPNRRPGRAAEHHVDQDSIPGT